MAVGNPDGLRTKCKECHNRIALERIKETRKIKIEIDKYRYGYEVKSLGHKNEPYYSESEMLNGTPTYSVEDLKGEELRILKTIK